MTIGIDASRANRKFKTGTEWYSFYLIKELAKIDQKNIYHIYTDQPLEKDLASLETNKNFKIKVLKWPFNYLWTQGRLSLEMLFKRPDILFIPSHVLPIIHAKKSVVTIHDIGFARQRQIYGADEIIIGKTLSRKLINFSAQGLTGGKYRANTLDYQFWSLDYALKHAKKIIAVSNFTKQEILELYQVKPDKISVVYHGYNAKIFKKIDQTAEMAQVLGKYEIKTPFIFYVGRLDRKKNIPNLIHAYAIMRQKYKKIKHKLVLAGGIGYGYDEVNYAIQEFNLNTEVIATGWVPEDDLPYLYNRASIFVFPSLYEGFGIPLLQAMACGVPIAASKAASIPEVVGPAASLFNPNDKEQIADVMAELILNTDLRNNLIKLGQEQVKNFSLEKSARQTLNVLENL